MMVREGERVLSYGDSAAGLLIKAQPYMNNLCQMLVTALKDRLLHELASPVIVSHIDRKTQFTLEAQLYRHVHLLFDPNISQRVHRARAHRLGCLQALIGIDLAWLLRTYEFVLRKVPESLDAWDDDVFARETLKKLLLGRLLVDLNAQIAGRFEMDRRQGEAIVRIDQLLTLSPSLDTFFLNALKILYGLPGVEAVVVGRPDGLGQIHYDFVIGEKFSTYLRAAQSIAGVPSIRCEEQAGQGPTGRAWATGQIQTIVSFAYDNSVALWRDAASAVGYVSAATAPLLDAEGRPQALVTLYHRLPGYFMSASRKSLLAHLQYTFGLALARFVRLHNGVGYHVGASYRALLEHGHLEMEYQPIIDLKTGGLREVEALARLRDQTGVLISPAQFLPHFGDRELLRLFILGLEQAVRTIKQWESVGIRTRVAINLPPTGLTDRAYIGGLREILKYSGVDPTRIILEVLETGEVRCDGGDVSILAELGTLGVGIAQDDLGSGYSSLTRLDNLPFDTVKIDQGLVRGAMGKPHKILHFVRHLTHLSHDLHLGVIVEGLESVGLVEAAAILGADAGQGYAIARPMGSDMLPSWVQSFRWAVDVARPSTAFGVYAAIILRRTQLLVLAPWPEMVRTLLRTPCNLSSYGQTLDSKHADLRQYCAIMSLGLHDERAYTDYEQVYRRMEGLLTERIIAEAQGR